MKDVKYKYVGKDRFYGIPARDLTADEFEALPPDLKRHVIANDSYKEVVATKKPAEAKSESTT